MLFNIGNGSFDIDVKANAEYYKNKSYVYQRCLCSSCRNFGERAHKSGDDILVFLSSLGLDPLKPTQAWAFLPGDPEETQRYMCRFPIYCKALTPMADWVKVCEGLLVLITEEEDGTFLNADWCMEWIHI